MAKVTEVTKDNVTIRVGNDKITFGRKKGGKIEVILIERDAQIFNKSDVWIPGWAFKQAAAILYKKSK